MRKTTTYLALTCVALGVGCGAADKALSTETSPESQPRGSVTIEESDLYRLEGDLLYVQNKHTGLNIVDVRDAARPKLVGRAPLSGGAGEMYLRGGHALVLLKQSSAGCRLAAGCSARSWSLGAELAIVDVTQKNAPRLVERYCLPGSLVNSRLVNDFLFIVTNTPTGGSRAYSFDVGDPAGVRQVAQMDFPTAGKEILVTPEALVVVGRAAAPQARCLRQVWSSGGWNNESCQPGADSNCVCESSSSGRTSVQYIEISPNNGSLFARGSFSVRGEAQGRFHIDMRGRQFRIVTFDSYQQESLLTLVSFDDPDRPTLLGQLDRIGRNEKLYATRFSEDKAYVVTFRETDPLWVITLSDPRRPRIVGELWVPGWSDFLYPRGNTLLAVGRGNRGRGVQVSMFDVTDIAHPRAISQVTVGDAGSESEANVDHRALTIVDDPARPLILVPYTQLQLGSSCYQSSTDNVLSIIEITPSALVVRGSLTQRGQIRRTLIVQGQLLSISDFEVLSADLGNLDYPRVDGSVSVGGQTTLGDGVRDLCDGLTTRRTGGGSMGMLRERHSWFGCSVPGSGNAAPLELLFVLGLFVVLHLRTRVRK